MLADVHPVSLTIDLEEAEIKSTPRCKAIGLSISAAGRATSARFSIARTRSLRLGRRRRKLSDHRLIGPKLAEFCCVDPNAYLQHTLQDRRPPSRPKNPRPCSLPKVYNRSESAVNAAYIFLVSDDNFRRPRRAAAGPPMHLCTCFRLIHRRSCSEKYRHHMMIPLALSNSGPADPQLREPRCGPISKDG